MGLIKRFTIVQLSLLLAIVFCGCGSTVKISDYYKFNEINIFYFQNYNNDSLKLNIDFNGSHRYIDLNSRNKVKLEPDVKKSLKSVAYLEKLKLFFVSKSTMKKWGSSYSCFLIDNKNLKYNKQLFTERNNILISEVFHYRNSANVICIKSIDDFSLVFLNSLYKRHPNRTSDEMQDDSLYLTRNTLTEVSSLVSGSEFAKTVSKRRKILDTINAAFNEVNKYFQPVTILESLDVEPYKTLKSFYYQALLTRISFLDDLEKLYRTRMDYITYLSDTNSKEEMQKKGESKISKNILDTIVTLAKANKVIMVNESHYDFRHRYFLYNILDSLYSNGYRNLCLEDYKNYNNQLSSFPQRKDGFYIQEPFMAQLIRKAKLLGFNIYPYEDTTGDINNYSSLIEKREYTQAKNFYKLYQADSNNKWIVYAGMEHVNKKSFMTNYQSFCMYFTRLSGINPFVMNQTNFSLLSNRTDYLINKPTGYYYFEPDSSNHNNKQADLYIANNIYQNPYLDIAGFQFEPTKKYRIVPQSETDRACKIFVYISKEFDQIGQKAIPIYIGSLKEHESLKLRLPADEYAAIITDENEKIIAGSKIHIEE